ncbi:MAG: T9SS type A sorting domain-containing protein, partial [Saprospiraceae bacterium]|nr:T9SS type A sorting domain-containing protein [Saprospiraceae bacterium]
ASGFAQIPIYVWDANGNNDFCLVNLRIIDNMGVGEGRIAGQIMTEEGEEVEGVMTELMSDSPEYPQYNMTNTNGEYAFNEIPMSSDYTVSGSKTDDYLNGVSTLDLLLIQRHILGQEQLSSAYKMIAADVNNDKDISAVDMIELRKLILGVYSELPSNDSWKVVDASENLTTANPWAYSESLGINDLHSEMAGQDFIGVKIGDVDGSVRANFNQNVSEKSSNVLELTYADGEVKTGEVVEVVMTSGDDALFGFQFTMDLNGMELVEVIGNNITEGNVAVFGEKMTMSYNSLDALNKNGEIFTMVLKATESGQVSDMIGINSGITKAEAYVGESLEVVDLNMRNADGEAMFALYQNQPNPFTEYTVIGYDLPENGEVTISFYDVTGRVLSVIEKDSEKGYNEVRVNRSDLGANGMIYYKLESKEHTATQHMMLIE